MAIDKLKDTDLRNAKPAEGEDGKPKERKLSDGGGLYLVVTPGGVRVWRFAYRMGGRGGRQREMTFGRYPDQIGDMLLSEIESPELLDVIEASASHKGQHEKAHRLLSVAFRVFQYGWLRKRYVRNPAADLRGSRETLTTHEPKKLPGITDAKQFGKLLHDIEGYPAREGGLVRLALKWQALHFVRPENTNMSCLPTSGEQIYLAASRGSIAVK